MLNAERFKEEINKHNNEFGLTDSIADCKTLECRNCRFSRLNNSDDEIILCSTRKVKWLLSEYKEPPVKVSKLEYDILKWIKENTQFEYIVRNEIGHLFASSGKPAKQQYVWTYRERTHELSIFDKLFKFVKCEDEKPTSIKDVLNHCEVVNDAEE